LTINKTDRYDEVNLFELIVIDRLEWWSQAQSEVGDGRKR